MIRFKIKKCLIYKINKTSLKLIYNNKTNIKIHNLIIIVYYKISHRYHNLIIKIFQIYLNLYYFLKNNHK